jgi:hypothetical protein
MYININLYTKLNINFYASIYKWLLIYCTSKILILIIKYNQTFQVANFIIQHVLRIWDDTLMIKYFKTNKMLTKLRIFSKFIFYILNWEKKLHIVTATPYNLQNQNCLHNPTMHFAVVRNDRCNSTQQEDRRLILRFFHGRRNIMSEVIEHLFC